MRIPQSHCLINQNFSSEKVEFVWQFPRKLDSPLKDQFILQIYRNPVVYFECGIIDASGEYTSEPVQFKLGYGHLVCGGIITSPLNWPGRVFPESYNYFTNGEDLIPLISDVTEYLKK